MKWLSSGLQLFHLPSRLPVRSLPYLPFLLLLKMESRFLASCFFFFFYHFSNFSLPFSASCFFFFFFFISVFTASSLPLSFDFHLLVSVAIFLSRAREESGGPAPSFLFFGGGLFLFSFSVRNWESSEVVWYVRWWPDTFCFSEQDRRGKKNSVWCSSILVVYWSIHNQITIIWADDVFWVAFHQPKYSIDLYILRLFLGLKRLTPVAGWYVFFSKCAIFTPARNQLSYLYTIRPAIWSSGICI